MPKYKLIHRLKMSKLDTENVLKEIDKIHQFSYEAIEQKRFDDYITIFSEKLTYKQGNGKIIDKKQITKDTKVYFNRLKTVKSKYQRKDYSIEGNRFTEHLIQKTTVSIKVFFFFTKKWTIEREATYKWYKIEDNWKIEKVDIFKENVY